MRDIFDVMFAEPPSAIEFARQSRIKYEALGDQFTALYKDNIIDLQTKNAKLTDLRASVKLALLKARWADRQLMGLSTPVRFSVFELSCLINGIDDALGAHAEVTPALESTPTAYGPIVTRRRNARGTIRRARK